MWCPSGIDGSGRLSRMKDWVRCYCLGALPSSCRTAAQDPCLLLLREDCLHTEVPAACVRGKGTPLPATVHRFIPAGLKMNAVPGQHHYLSNALWHFLYLLIRWVYLGGIALTELISLTHCIEYKVVPNKVVAWRPTELARMKLIRGITLLFSLYGH